MNTFSYYPESTFPGIFRNRVFVYNKETFLRHRGPDSWIDISWEETARNVNAISSYLINSGVKPGDKIGIFSENRPEWVFTDIAVLSAGAADVTIYPTNSASEAAFIISDSDTRICFCSGKQHVEKLLSVKDELPALEKIIVFNDGEYGSEMVVTLEKVIREGSENDRGEEIENRIRSINPEDVMTIMYTSGTTGNPKGVMLSTSNMVAEVLSMMVHQPHPLREQVLSILPLSHALERSIGYYLIVYNGGSIAYARGTDKLVEDLVEIRPTAMISVPRLAEKLYEGINAKAAKAPPMKKRMFDWAVKTAYEAAPILHANRPLSGLLKIKYAIASKLVLSPLRTAIGMDRLFAFGSGGAPLSEEIQNFFSGIGIFILPGYGLTETAPVTHVQHYRTIYPIKPGSVGKTIHMTECKIADDGEILLRGPQIMMGYYKNEKATRDAFTEDGFFKTGDIGRIDDDGYLYITDRKKDIIITAGGKNISPQVIEAKMLLHPMIEQTTLIGDNRKYITALIVPSFNNLAHWAQENGITDTAPASLVKNEKVQKYFDTIVAEINTEMGRVEQIKRFTLLERPFSLENNEITPTLKIKRKKVQENYNSIIEDMYKE
ncbi:MAG TPA: long-chain fatty acid--CoA ligase [Deltaproteobacteria bacterium]|nr:long-chain fatty acid--CoA ligase [Deltaproteobacteria bacterium]